MSERLTVGHLSAVAQQIPGNPAIADWGVAAASIARCEANIAESPVYVGPVGQAASLFHTLLRLPMLEFSNALFAIAASLDLLQYHGVECRARPSDWAELAVRVAEGDASVDDVHSAIKAWTAT
ncbi:fic family toxin-antitoxin system, toxin component [Streptomyces kaniharaensis]|uniref:Fic family toxin-antitoxin system, toxin component n=1 Tax=Streptomyces kaniharaensis TaxID=212423 RepID=A0A6N7L2J3_9ACTN|nr:MULTISPECIES: hypothetical protein [Streptomyces]MQS17415.1 fic family toxin-antitoxin system, toxin component [Streptomyces kaniharaensis]